MLWYVMPKRPPGHTLSRRPSGCLDLNISMYILVICYDMIYHKTWHKTTWYVVALYTTLSKCQWHFPNSPFLFSFIHLCYCQRVDTGTYWRFQEFSSNHFLSYACFLLNINLIPWCQRETLKSQAKLVHFHQRKYIWKYRLRNGTNFISAPMC